MTIFFNMKEVTMQISEKQVDNLEDKIIYKPAFQKQKMVTPISLPYYHTNKSPLSPQWIGCQIRGIEQMALI